MQSFRKALESMTESFSVYLALWFLAFLAVCLGTLRLSQWLAPETLLVRVVLWLAIAQPTLWLAARAVQTRAVRQAVRT